ncbi:CRISPR-associated protein Cas4 [Azospirillum argentinense]|uniref:CRISPR-associated exonuclease Cas4 n=1 Tax=Azospirillum argentinense TaxID=2970906 RepID=A0A4D8PBC7_9PROT|nr:CRISPR-associated protein Cas4 [Azospirillum argentinense]QCN95916.1 CRISPR-associated protein Cas4 [Azospirillum argentinense]
MEADDSALVPLSALQHLAFCARQCGLIHLEDAWAENALTAEGRVLHERVDNAPGETRRGVRIARGVPLRHRRLGLVGRADVVEFHNRRGLPPLPCPVEYKRGKAKPHDADRVQLCAQGLCLEEMLGLEVPSGALFYGETRRRQEVAFDAALRARTEALAGELHALLASRVTPPPEPGPKCRSCSLEPFCLPTLSGSRSAAVWLDRMLRADAAEGAAKEDPP